MDWKEMTVNVTIQPSSEKSYGLVKRGNKFYFRNYHRLIRKGYSFIDIFHFRIEESKRMMLSFLDREA